MKLVVILVVVSCICSCYAQRQPNQRQARRQEQNPDNQYQENSNRQQQQPQQQKQQQQQQQEYISNDEQQFTGKQSVERTTYIPILSYNNVQTADGGYKASYETGNHILSEETGFLKNLGEPGQNAQVQHGSYSYTSPEGIDIKVTYTADEHGYRAEGLHLPTPPPVPAEIQKSLDQIYEGIRLQAERRAKFGPQPGEDYDQSGAYDPKFDFIPATDVNNQNNQNNNNQNQNINQNEDQTDNNQQFARKQNQNQNRGSNQNQRRQ